MTIGTVLTSFDSEDGLTPLGTITATERIEQEQMMYNLTVDTAHTFFVGEGEWLAHNSGCDLTGHRSKHILDNHRFGQAKFYGGKPKTEFPANWTDQEILEAVSDLATDPKAFQGVQKYGRCAKGIVNGILMRVDYYPDNHPKYPGLISTGFPISVGSDGDIGCQ